jgi:dTDP-4-dehydrorhamnose 3,5-epimerase
MTAQVLVGFRGGDMRNGWVLEGAHKEGQSITADWELAAPSLIDGVVVKQMKNVLKGDGFLTEIFRRDWFSGVQVVDQVFQVTMFPGAIVAWHAHEHTTDRLFVALGQCRIVLYDSRPGSPTCGMINEFKLGSERGGLVEIPPKVWHGVQNLHPGNSIVLNLADRAYEYKDPDDWRLPQSTSLIPYQFPSVNGLPFVETRTTA